MKILVTGATGFIGKHLVPRLLTEKFDVVCLARQSSNKPEFFKNDVVWEIGDFNDPGSLKDMHLNIDLVIHLAGVIKSNKRGDFFRVNTTGTKNLLGIIPKGKKIIFISSQTAIGPSRTLTPLAESANPAPISTYGRSKLLAEQLITRVEKPFRYTIIRPGIVFGPHDRESLSIFRLAKYHLNPYIGFHKSYVNIVHVDDLVNFIMLCIQDSRSNGEIFHINDGQDQGYTQNELIRKAAEYLQTWTAPVFIPKFLLKSLIGVNSLFARVSGKIPMLNQDKYNELTARGWLLSSQKAREIMNYQPHYDINSGFKSTINWYQEKGWL